ncbi:MAG: hypothetical protein FJ265_03040 [Planctomycetes bacterium]|nr:hypothetical protein [Planctomycetota bacterium]
MLRSLVPIVCAAALAAQTQPPPGAGKAPAGKPAAELDPAREFFAKGELVDFEITLGPAQQQRLREKPREYVTATVRADRKETWPSIGIKIKGSAGSFQNLDERPGFTLHLGKFGGTARFHGLQRFHLNNGAQDESRLCEWLGNEIFTAAGHPAPRVAHARVRLDGRDLGLYVLREAYDRQFLLRTFGNVHGNLYDGGFCQDLDADLEKDAGDGPDDHADLRRLRELCRGFDTERITRYEQAVDAEAMIDFCALEAMLGHWDGYGYNRNNFRLWIPAAPGRARFLPHGMDQLLGDADASILRHPHAMVASALMQVPAWRKRYRERLKQLLPLFLPNKLVPKVKALAGKLRKELHALDPGTAEDFDDAVQDLVQRIEARYRNLQDQVKAPEPKPQQFPAGRPLALKTWRPAAETEHLELGKKGFQGVQTFLIASTGRGEQPLVGSFRASLLLGKGRYRLSGLARCEKVEAPPPNEDGSPTGGARLAVDDARSERLFGDQNWKQLDCEFEVTEFQREVELRLELRAMQGRAWFRCDTLRIEKLPE